MTRLLYAILFTCMVLPFASCASLEFDNLKIKRFDDYKQLGYDAAKHGLSADSNPYTTEYYRVGWYEGYLEYLSERRPDKGKCNCNGMGVTKCPCGKGCKCSWKNEPTGLEPEKK